MVIDPFLKKSFGLADGVSTTWIGHKIYHPHGAPCNELVRGIFSPLSRTRLSVLDIHWHRLQLTHLKVPLSCMCGLNLV